MFVFVCLSLFSPAVSSSFGSGVRSPGFNTIDLSGLYDTSLTTAKLDKSSQYDITDKYDTGVKSSHYDGSLKSGQYDAGVRSGQYDISLKSGQYDTGVRSGQYDISLKSGQYDTGVKSTQYDGSLKSGQYDTGVRSVQYDTTVRSGQYDTLDSMVLPTFSWSTSTLPSSSTAVIAGNTSSYTYQTGQVSANNMAGGFAPLSPASPSSLSGKMSNIFFK